MALGKNEKTLFNKLLADWNGLLAPVYASKSAIQKATNDMINKLKEMVQFDLFTGEAALNAAIQDFGDQVKDQIPGDELDDLQRLKNFLDNCEYLQPLEPISALIGTALGISDEIENLIDKFFDSFNIPEFGAANFGSIIDNLLAGLPGLPGGDALADLLAQADKLINCLSALCALQDPSYSADLTSMSDELQELYDDLRIVDNPASSDYGKLDYSAIYADVPLNADQINAINNTKAGLNNAKNSGVNAVNNTKSAIQQASKIGGLFS